MQGTGPSRTEASSRYREVDLHWLFATRESPFQFHAAMKHASKASLSSLHSEPPIAGAPEANAADIDLTRIVRRASKACAFDGDANVLDC